jgi:hypothetical protein
MVCFAWPGKTCWVVGSRYIYAPAVVTGMACGRHVGVVVSPSLTCCRTWCMHDIAYRRIWAFVEAAGMCLELFTLQQEVLVTASSR